MRKEYFLKPSHILKTFVTIVLGVSTWAAVSKPSHSAEKVKLIYGPFNGKISVASLEKFASSGEMTREFRLYSKFLDKEALSQLRYWLSSRFECDRVEMYKFANSPEGEKFLTEVGTAIKTHPKRNGLYAIRASLIEAADKPGESDGWTIVEAMHSFPTEDLQINTKDLFKLKNIWGTNNNQNQAAMEIFLPQPREKQVTANSHK